VQVDIITIVSIVALVVSLASVIVAWRTSHHQRRLQGRQNELQERLVELETARERDRLRQARSAQLLASIERVEKGKPHVPRTDYFLKIVNHGQAAARDIRILLDGKPMSEHPLIIRGEPELAKLGPGAESRSYLAFTMGSDRVFDVRVTWNDEAGPGEWESQLKA
jgi:hypothetical protein